MIRLARLGMNYTARKKEACLERGAPLRGCRECDGKEEGRLTERSIVRMHTFLQLEHHTIVSPVTNRSLYVPLLATKSFKEVTLRGARV